MLWNAVEWFKHRSYDYKQFSDLEALAPASATSASRSARSCPAATSPTPWAVSSTRSTPSTIRRVIIRWSTRS